MLLYCFQVSIASNEKSVLNDIVVPLAALKFFLSLVFNSLTMMCLGVIFFVSARSFLSF